MQSISLHGDELGINWPPSMMADTTSNTGRSAHIHVQYANLSEQGAAVLSVLAVAQGMIVPDMTNTRGHGLMYSQDLQ